MKKVHYYFYGHGVIEKTHVGRHKKEDVFFNTEVEYSLKIDVDQCIKAAKQAA